MHKNFSAVVGHSSSCGLRSSSKHLELILHYQRSCQQIMMGIRHSTDSVRVRIVLTAIEDKSGDLTGAVPLVPADARIHDRTRLARRNALQNAGKLSSNSANLSECSDPALISGPVAVCSRLI
jgi:hypothetical protein